MDSLEDLSHQLLFELFDPYDTVSQFFDRQTIFLAPSEGVMPRIASCNVVFMVLIHDTTFQVQIDRDNLRKFLSIMTPKLSLD